jgi:hypothetical protein
MTRGNIDDAQSAMAQANAVVDENARIVRTSMRDDVTHSLHDVSLNVTSGAGG